jgi:hypothetical protein
MDQWIILRIFLRVIVKGKEVPLGRVEDLFTAGPTATNGLK